MRRRTCMRRATRAPAARWSARNSAVNSAAPARLTSSVAALGCSSPRWTACHEDWVSSAQRDEHLLELVAACSCSSALFHRARLLVLTRMHMQV